MRTITGCQLERCFELIVELEQLPAEARAADIQVRRAKGVEDHEGLSYVAFHFALPSEPAEAPQDDWCDPGAQIGSCILGDKLGVGGMSVVYRARQTTELMDRPVALKFIHPALVFTGKTEAAEQFKRESQTLTKFDHTHRGTAMPFRQKLPQRRCRAINSSVDLFIVILLFSIRNHRTGKPVVGLPVLMAAWPCCVRTGSRPMRVSPRLSTL